jgi:alpha-mannosidase
MSDTATKKLFLICNAHLDPVWLWSWEEGLAEALSTFRLAAGFCDEFPAFVFCHNEALLYQWVEKHDPGLFQKIRELVAAKKWHIMGGWYLQPDCNLPSGESLVRQILVGKQYFREKFQVEPTVAVNLYFMTERMATNAFLQLRLPYPQPELQRVLTALLFCEFHDSLPGSSVREVEESVLQELDYGLEILAQVRMRIFLELLAGQAQAADDEFPIFVYNSHDHDGAETIVCEFQPQEPNLDQSTFWLPELVDEHGRVVPVQLEKGSCNIATEQRKRIVFTTPLHAASMHRFSCRLRTVPAPGPSAGRISSPPASFVFRNESCCVEINYRTGLIDRYAVHGVEALRPGAFLPMVMKDDADPWGMRVRSFRNAASAFRLMTGEEAAAFAGIDSAVLPPVRIIEQGPVRTVLEALFIHGFSRLCLRYVLPARGSEIEIGVRVFWEERNRMLELSIPTCFPAGKCFGQALYGVDEHPPDGEEKVGQEWLAIQSANGETSLTVINDGTYQFDFTEGELRISLLRSPVYAGHPTDESDPIVRQDRFESRIDQGEHQFTYWLNSGPAQDRFVQVSKEAAFKNEPGIALCVFPSGRGSKPVPGIRLSNPAVQVGALKMSEDGTRVILRLETTGHPQDVTASIPALAMEFHEDLLASELKSLAIDLSDNTVHQVDLLERRCSRG